MDDVCQPPLSHRNSSGWHWLVQNTLHAMHFWQPGDDVYNPKWRGMTPAEAAQRGWAYVAPVATPAEVDALREELDLWRRIPEAMDGIAPNAPAATVSHCILAQKWEMAELRKEVERLRGATITTTRTEALEQLAAAARSADTTTMGIEKALRALDAMPVPVAGAHPLLVALVDMLPRGHGSTMSRQERMRWLQATTAALRLVYGDHDLEPP